MRNQPFESSRLIAGSTVILGAHTAQRPSLSPSFIYHSTLSCSACGSVYVAACKGSVPQHKFLLLTWTIINIQFYKAHCWKEGRSYARKQIQIIEQRQTWKKGQYIQVYNNLSLTPSPSQLFLIRLRLIAVHSFITIQISSSCKWQSYIIAIKPQHSRQWSDDKLAVFYLQPTAINMLQFN